MNNKVDNLVADVLQIPLARITDELAMRDVDTWDSLKHMELVASIEETFDIQLTFDEIVAIQSVQEIKRVLRKRGAVS